MLQDADKEAAEDVDEHDQDAGHGVPAHEFRGTVHRPEEVGFVGDGGAALARFVLADQPGVEVGIDGHLLAGHRVEGEAGGDFSDAPGALGDDHEVDDHQNGEDDNPDGVVATDEEMPEGVDHLPGRPRPGMAFEQHDARRGDVERQPQQRGDQQHRREHREIQRLHDVDGHQHDDHRDGDVEGEKDVEQEGRQRQHHHRQDQQDEDRPRQLLDARAAKNALQGQGGVSHGSAPQAPVRQERRFHAAAAGSGHPPCASCRVDRRRP